ncbi:ankyrin repeat-containing domain protein [Rutstroemia sp. NJR-2017a BBW]|nr:ankyrin repeat-containing domain protein [Rutstroemia sp. NJR-2017a BBW]
MNLLDLPDELVSNVLLQAVVARGIKRALRLRFVNKRFSRDVQSALFESRLLDRFYTGDILNHWYTHKNQATATFWHSYLVYRVQNESTLSFPRYTDIRQAAQRVCEETNADLVSTIKIICWPALIRGTNPYTSCSSQPVDWRLCTTLEWVGGQLKNPPIFNLPAGTRFAAYSQALVKSYLPTPDLDLLCIAAYLNLIPLATRLIEGGVSPAGISTIFGSPMELAAWAGNAKMLENFQEHLTEVADIVPPLQEHHTPLCNDKVNQGAILGVAILGNIDMVKLALYPPSRAVPDSLDISGQKCGQVARYSATGNAIVSAKWATRNLDVYKYLQSLYTLDEGRIKHESHDVAIFAQWGNLEVVKYLLDTGAGVNGAHHHTRSLNPLSVACRRGYSDIVCLLLERGVDVDYKDNTEVLIYPAICVAARAGNFAIVRQLVQHGSKDDFQNGWVEAFAAVRKCLCNTVVFMDRSDIWPL